MRRQGRPEEGLQAPLTLKLEILKCQLLCPSCSRRVPRETKPQGQSVA